MFSVGGLRRALFPEKPVPGSALATALEEQTRHGLAVLGLVALVQPLAGGLAYGALAIAHRLHLARGQPSDFMAEQLWISLPLFTAFGVMMAVAARTRMGGRYGGKVLVCIIIGMMTVLAWLEAPFRTDGGPSIMPFVLLIPTTIIPYRPLSAAVVSALGGLSYLAMVAAGPLSRALELEPRLLIAQDTLPLVFASVATTLAISTRVYAGRRTVILNRIEKDELAARNEAQAQQLARTNRELLEAQNELVRRRHLSVLGNLVAGVSHELNNPVGALGGAVDVLGRGMEKLEGAPTEAERGRALRAMRTAHESASAAAKRVQSVVRSLKLFARLDEADEQEVDLSECIEAALEVTAPGPSIHVERSFEAHRKVRCRPAHMNEVFRDLIANALEAMRGQGTLRLGTRVQDGELRASIEDDGPGVPPKLREQIFEPGYTTKGNGVGVGLGLATSLRLVEEQGGRIELASGPGGGAIFTVVLRV